MSSQYYEVALFGEFFSQDLKAILNRITLHSESAQAIHTHEIVFEPLDAQYLRDTGSEPVLLRAKKELSEPNSPWYMSSFPLLPRPKTCPQGIVFLSQARVSSRSSRSNS